VVGHPHPHPHRMRIPCGPPAPQEAPARPLGPLAPREPPVVSLLPSIAPPRWLQDLLLLRSTSPTLGHSRPQVRPPVTIGRLNSLQAKTTVKYIK
jgi:hypothetical protein